MGVYRSTSPGHKVKVPVLPYVKKVLLHEYGPEPIQVKSNTLLGKHLMSMPIDLSEVEEQKCYGDVVVFEIQKALLPYFEKYKTIFQTGYYFEKVAQRMMLAHIEAQHRMGGKILDAIEDWFEMYGIEDGEDYTLTAAYELWKEKKRRRAKHLSKP